MLTTLDLLKLIRRAQREGAEETISGILEHIAKNHYLKEGQYSDSRDKFIKIMQEMTEIKD